MSYHYAQQKHSMSVIERALLCQATR